MNVSAVFRERLATCRKSARRSIDSVAHESGYSRTYLRRLERGDQANPTICAVWAIAEALDTTPQYLLGLTDQPT